MTSVFSGGCVYEFFQSRATGYGLVRREEDGGVRTTKEFRTLRERLREACLGDGGLNGRGESWEEIRNTEDWRGGFPAASRVWPVMPEVPATVVDWGVVEAAVLEEREEWVVVGVRDLDLEAGGLG
jgi:hypothetical protein